MRFFILVLVALALIGPQLVLASGTCEVPAQTIADKSKEVLKLLEKEGCSYSFKKGRKLVTEVSSQLKEGFECAQVDGRSQDAELLEFSSKELLDTFSTICAR